MNHVCFESPSKLFPDSVSGRHSKPRVQETSPFVHPGATWLLPSIYQELNNVKNSKICAHVSKERRTGPQDPNDLSSTAHRGGQLDLSCPSPPPIPGVISRLEVRAGLEQAPIRVTLHPPHPPCHSQRSWCTCLRPRRRFQTQQSKKQAAPSPTRCTPPAPFPQPQ